MGNLIKKTSIAPFINKGTASNPEWVRLKKSVSFNMSFNPQVKTFDFISDEQPTEEVDSYQPSLSQDLTMYKGEEDYELVFDMAYHMPVGEKARKDFLIVFFAESGKYDNNGDEVTVYKAWKTNSLIKLNQLDSVNSNITFDISLSNPEKGAVTKDSSGKISFIKGTFAGETFTAE